MNDRKIKMMEEGGIMKMHKWEKSKNEMIERQNSKGLMKE